MVYTSTTGRRDNHLGDWIQDIEKDISNIYLKVLCYFKLTPLQSSKSEVTLPPKILNKTLINPHIKRIELEDIEVKYSISLHKNLQNIRGYNQYTNKLVEEMIRLRSEGLMYKDIAGYLTDRGYKSSKGKELSAKLTERMIAKRRISNERGKVKKIEFSDIVIELLRDNSKQVK